MALWSYSCGRKGVSRVRVYERAHTRGLYVEWYYDGERHQRSLKTVAGHAVTDHALAEDIARDMSAKLEQDGNRAARHSAFGYQAKATLAGLFDALHEVRGLTWSDSHRRDQERFRRYWLDKLGDCALTAVNAAVVESVTMADAERWSPKTHARYRLYIVEAYDFAERKLKWIEPRHNLSAVDIPKGKSKSLPYTTDEVRALLAGLETVNARAAWIGHVAWQTGRRLTAIRTLPKSAVTLHDGYAVLHFPAETDKARNSGEVPVVGRAYELTRILMDSPGNYVLGRRPPRKELCIKGWLPKAEEAAGIVHQPGRGWHAIKRRYARATEHLQGREKQSGTTKVTLDTRYAPDDMALKLAIARHQAEVGENA